MKCYCETCKAKDCELRDQINFCEDCKDYADCPIKESCEAGYDIECNNGFELDENYSSYPEYDEFAMLFGGLDEEDTDK